MEYEVKPYVVFVKLDDANRITDVNSSAFILNQDGWMEIDRGYTQRHHHAQGNYFPQPIIDERGVYRYKLVDGQAMERTQEERDADYAARPVPATPKTNAELEAENALLKAQVQAVADRNEFVEDCIAEMAMYVYAQ